MQEGDEGEGGADGERKRRGWKEWEKGPGSMAKTWGGWGEGALKSVFGTKVELDVGEDAGGAELGDGEGRR
ncbi:hypothetical protein TIFTF001_053923 [Ficus carica]|uniref:Uncharacterized protein n=1 Tax=Ficus carica TaxID=3494 RepID=A0AA88EPI1_FICCA|nr:hypothetical protein TIFTF001_053923 [Ficus carica]